MYLMQGDVLTRDDLYKRGPNVHAKMGLQMIFSGDFKSHSRSVHQKIYPCTTQALGLAIAFGLGRWQAGSPGSWLTEFFNVGMAFTHVFVLNRALEKKTGLGRAPARRQTRIYVTCTREDVPVPLCFPPGAKQSPGRKAGPSRPGRRPGKR